MPSTTSSCEYVANVGGCMVPHARQIGRRKFTIAGGFSSSKTHWFISPPSRTSAPRRTLSCSAETAWPDRQSAESLAFRHYFYFLPKKQSSANRGECTAQA